MLARSVRRLDDPAGKCLTTRPPLTGPRMMYNLNFVWYADPAVSVRKKAKSQRFEYLNRRR